MLAPPDPAILARPALAYAARLSEVSDEPQRDLIRHAANLLDRFAQDLARAGLSQAAIGPARQALALVLDVKARANPAIDVQTWADAADERLFQRQHPDIAALSRFAAGDKDNVARFVADCLNRLEQGRTQSSATPRTTGWTGIVLVLVLAYIGAVLGWIGLSEWRFHRDLTQVFQAEALQIGLDRDGAIPDLAPRLARLSQASERLHTTRALARTALFSGPFGFDAAVIADAAYHEAIGRHVPPVMAQAIGRALADEGEALPLYDTLRALAILEGRADWAADYLAGWADDRSASDPSLAGLSPHIRRLTGPPATFPAQDAELLAQATAFAADADEAGRAYLELSRSGAVATLAPWRGDQAIAGFRDAFQRRSGTAIDAGLPGLFTQGGWDHARDFGAGLAVLEARRQALALFGRALPQRNDAPDLLMDRLQRETLAQWSAYLADLRVRAFTSADTSVVISGLLSRRDSPLAQLFKHAWHEVGGTDRSRSTEQQLQIAAAFGPMIQYVEQGGADRIAALFAGLNVALGAMDRDEPTGQQRLMSAQERAASVAALDQAPRELVQIVEDTLVQAGSVHADLVSNPLNRAWQNQILPLCHEAIEGRFPFSATGPDAEPAATARLLAPGGAIDAFLGENAEAMLDTSEHPWRWKPEARFAGLAPEGALFLERSRALTQGIFNADGTIGMQLTLSALAERGRATMTIGGRGGRVEAATDSLVLAWPGPDPAAGAEVAFQTGASNARLAETGPWGLLRLLDPLRLRERDEGGRLLVDLRAGGARLFLEIRVDTAQNPLSQRGLLRGFSCPAML